MTLSCKEVTQLISQGLDKELPQPKRQLMLAHFAVCKGCRAVNERMDFLRRAMKQLAERDETDKS